MAGAPEAYAPHIPESQWEIISAFVQDVVAQTAQQTPYNSRRLMNAVMHHVAWAWRAGVPLEADTMFQRDLIDFSIRDAFAHLSPGSLSTIRAQLLRVGEAVAPVEAMHRLKPLPASGTSQPYTSSELADLYVWAEFQSTRFRRASALALVALGAGAGLSSGEILRSRNTDIVTDAVGTVVNVGPPRPRAVPVLTSWQAALRTAIEDLDDDTLVFRPGPRREHSNTLTNFIRKSNGTGLKPQSQRLRATWIVTHLQASTPTLALLEAAGVESLEAFTRYVKYLAPMPVDRTRVVLHEAEAVNGRQASAR